MLEIIQRPAFPVEHHEDEYDSSAFAILRKMQERHFWYRGRHRFLWHAVKSHLDGWKNRPSPLRGIDLGGGCGGWIKYLLDRKAPFDELALADSSPTALENAARILPVQVAMHQVDLLRLGWQGRWEVAFLLDVLEHIPDHQTVLREIRSSLAPGGLLFVTTPALQSFWTWNDAAVHHQRRYCKDDYRRLAKECGYSCLSADYFMFFLSPLVMLTRWTTRLRYGRRGPKPEELPALVEATHQVPAWPVNEALSAVFAAETPLGHIVPFPWGTSVLGVFRRDD